MCRFDPGFLECRLCPRECRVNRFEPGKGGYAGFCRQNHELRVAYIGPHFGEEPPLTGTRGSGTSYWNPRIRNGVFLRVFSSLLLLPELPDL